MSADGIALIILAVGTLALGWHQATKSRYAIAAILMYLAGIGVIFGMWASTL